MPAAVTLTLALPPELGDPALLLAALRGQVAATEAVVAAERIRTGARVVGRRTILRQSWRACPTSLAGVAAQPAPADRRSQPVVAHRGDPS